MTVKSGEGTTFLLIRHGEIDANVKRLWHGSTDSELNAKGHTQATEMGVIVREKYREISCIYASPLKRTMKTAEALGNVISKTPVPYPGIREYGIGDLEGEPYEHLLHQHNFFESISKSQDYAPVNGESVNQVRDRMLDAFHQIANQHPGEKVALVSHGAAMAIGLATLLDGSPFPFHEYHMSNTGISQLRFGQVAELIEFNDTTHLLQTDCLT